MSKVTSDELALLRTYPQRTNLYLGVQQGVALLTAQVDGDHAQGETAILLKDVVCDDLDDLVRGMTVSIGALEIHNRKVTAVFLSYDDGTLTLTIGPNAHIAHDDDYVTVYSAFHLWKMDAPAFSAQKTPPFAIMGPPRAGFAGEPLSYVGDCSYSPVGRTLDTFAWKKFDATLVSGDLALANTIDDPLVLQWDTAGEYLVKLKVEDSAGERGVSFRPALIYDRTGDNAPYQEFILKNLRSNGQGWSVDFTVYGDASEDSFPPEALIVVWKEDWYGSTKQTIGGAYRGASEILFCGWIRDNSIRANIDDHSVTFSVDSIDAVMSRLTIPGFTFRDGDDATGWTTFDTLTIDKAALHIIQQRTTLSKMADVFMGLFGFEVGIVDVPEASLYDQLRQSLAQAVFGFVRGSRFASVTVARDRNVITDEMRSLLGTASIEFTSSDWLELTIKTESFASLARVRIEGRLADDTPVAAYYPDTGPGHSGELKVISGMIFKTQDQCDELAVRIYRKGNRRIKAVKLRLPNYCLLEPAFQEYFTVILQAGENAASYHWTNELNGDTGREFTCTGMSIEFVDNYLMVTVDGETSLFGAHGADWTLPTSGVLTYTYGYASGVETISPFALTSDVDVVLTDDADAILTGDV